MKSHNELIIIDFIHGGINDQPCKKSLWILDHILTEEWELSYKYIAKIFDDTLNPWVNRLKAE